jgi:hypothetical protein
LTETVATALLLEQGLTAPRKALVALRYARRHLVADAGWSDRIASVAGREILAYEDIDAALAAKAAA